MLIQFHIEFDNYKREKTNFHLMIIKKTTLPVRKCHIRIKSEHVHLEMGVNMRAI